MAAITMCTNKSCPVKEACYRYTATPSYPQSYAEFEWGWEVKDKNRKVSCKHFLPIKE